MATPCSATGPQVRVRPMTAGDVSGCAQMVRDHPLFQDYGLDPERLEGELRAALSRGDGLLVAVVGERPAGFAWYLERGCFGRSPYLRLLVVAASFVGTGIGTRLMDEVEARAFEVAGDLFLLVNVDNRRAQAFYERRGYARVGQLLDYVRTGVHEYLYRKRRPGGPTATGPLGSKGEAAGG